MAKTDRGVQMKEILKDSLCYLMGAMDNAPDQGKGWRRWLIEECKARGLKIKFLDPTNKVSGLQSEVEEERKKIVTLKSQEKWDELAQMMKTVVRQDHSCIDFSDFVICYLDVSVHTCGSYFELQSALTEKKPYFIVVTGGKKLVPAWLFGVCDHRYFFDDLSQVVEYLSDLNAGNRELSDRWVLIRKQIKDL